MGRVLDRRIVDHRGILAAVLIAMITPLAATAARATTYTVNTTDDSSGNRDCSLRDAINAANGAPTVGSTCGGAGSGSDTIAFSAALAGGTITLGSTLPAITDTGLNITGPTTSPSGIIIDGNNAVLVMQVSEFGALQINNVTIAHGNNVAGGGINNAGMLTVTNSMFFKNNGGSGGGIYNVGTLMVTNTTFFENSAYSGGGIYDAAESGLKLTISNSTFADNQAIGTGGGLLTTGFGTIAVTDSTFSDNHAGTVGGGGSIMTDSPGPPVGISNTTFTGNSADVGGGGLFCTLSSLNAMNVTNSTFAGNTSAGAGGAIFHDGAGGILNVTSSTFFANIAGTNGGGIFTPGSPPDNVKGTIFADESSGGNCAGYIADAGYNLDDDGTCGFSSGVTTDAEIGLDPKGLQSNGGLTQTIALEPGSVAIDAIPASFCTYPAGATNPCATSGSSANQLTCDQRGMPRPDFLDGTGGNCDVGAYEFQDFAGAPGRANCDGKSVSALANEYGGLGAAASALGYPSVKALQAAIRQFCGG